MNVVTIKCEYFHVLKHQKSKYTSINLNFHHDKRQSIVIIIIIIVCEIEWAEQDQVLVCHELCCTIAIAKVKEFYIAITKTFKKKKKTKKTLKFGYSSLQSLFFNDEIV